MSFLPTELEQSKNVAQTTLMTAHTEQLRKKLRFYLKRSIADEYYSFLQYRQELHRAKGKGRKDTAEMALEHAEEEYKHVQMLENRLYELGGRTIGPNLWEKYKFAGYIDPPKDGCCLTILQNDITGESKAIEHYRDFIEFTKEIKDETTRRMLQKILEDENHHLKEAKELLEETSQD